ncbi:glycosyltransferase family 2 protein [Bacillus sp. FJAT-18017]|uniref:glycosyltransferase family 2 protein n=1 Tax=Bacillus sp. FJAT-18017 TaxID=1705566 RepID=UPI0018D13411|nr:glycosyltransferase [Bacillus sp. FJAT-18017]
MAKDLGVPDFYKMVFKYNAYESSCAIKPHLLNYLLNKFQDEEKFVYLDSDIKVYSPLEELKYLLDNYSIVITPHRLAPQDEYFTDWEEAVNLKDGVFNGGLIGIRRDTETREFLNWWGNRVLKFCYIDHNRGLFLDQKWLNLIPCFFDNYKVLKHVGYNVASWNFSQRKIETSKDNQLLVNGLPLRFIHFSGLGRWFDQKLEIYVDKSNILYMLKTEYLDEAETYEYNSMKDHPWCYNYFNSGESIQPKTKTLYRESEGLQMQIPFPFHLSNKHIKEYQKKMKNSPTVSVITAVYNGQEFLMEAINSILSQSYTNFEYIIVNDGSTDKTNDLLSRINDSRVKVINLKKNMGAAYCLNLAINKAKGKWIAVQDADDISYPDRLEKQVGHVESHPDVIAVGSMIECISDTLTEDQLAGMVSHFNSLKSRDELYRNRFFQTPFCHGTGFFLKNAYLQVGGYDKNYRIAYDWDLWMKLYRKGPIDKVNQILYKYRIDKSSLSFKKWESTYFEIIKLTVNQINKMHGKNKRKPTLLIYGTAKTRKNFKTAILSNEYNNPVKYKDYKELKNKKPFSKKSKTNVIIILEEHFKEEVIKDLEKKGFNLNRNLFLLHNGNHGFIENGYF